MGSELIAMAHIAKEGIYYEYVVGARIRKMSSTVFHSSETTLALFTPLATLPIARNKHIALRLFFLKELVRDGKITHHRIPTQKTGG